MLQQFQHRFYLTRMAKSILGIQGITQQMNKQSHQKMMRKLECIKFSHCYLPQIIAYRAPNALFNTLPCLLFKTHRSFAFICVNKIRDGIWNANSEHLTGIFLFVPVNYLLQRVMLKQFITNPKSPFFYQVPVWLGFS